MNTQSFSHERADTQEVLDLAARKACQYLATVGQRSVAPSEAALAGLAAFHEPFPNASADPLEVISKLDQIGSPATVATTGGRYFGFVIGGTLPASLAANWLAATWDQNVTLRVMSPVAAELEEVVLRWVAEAIGLPPECPGGLVTCATMANFTALAAARGALLSRAGWNVEDDGMFGAPPIEVVVGEEVHASILKALSMAGFGKKRVTVVPADGQGRMRADRLPRLSSSTLVCIQAGNVNTGAFDPAEEICARAHEQGAWVHVDGAFGLWAGVSAKYRDLMRGVAMADSWGTDAHKWPNVNYDCGVVFVRDGHALRTAMGMSAAYLEPGSRREPTHHAPESSRRGRAIELWAALKSLGRSGLCDLVERTCGFAQMFASGLREAGFSVLNDVVLNQVLVSFGTAETTREAIRRIQQDGTCWCGGTVWQGKTAMRISVSSWATTEADVRASLDAMVRIARECNQASQPR
ncbi:MAG TPA: aminotransferase class V-fold PLP-dependent enzyme [Candidatus Saccharimonadales bacterium]|nr:aminotransferase class V-fold PLP-dependent enzyme [Candidatus Saccharimonadales bacterium]